MEITTGIFAALAATVAGVAGGVMLRRRKVKRGAREHGAELGTVAAGTLFVIQPVSDFHAGTDHVDYSQAGYAVIDDVGGSFRWAGPYRNAAGQIEAMRPSQQSAWAASVGGRLPTAAEFDAIYEAADFKITPKPRNVETAPLTAMDADAIAAGAKAGDSIAIGKTWMDGEYNYGWYPPAAQVQFSSELGHYVWPQQGLQVYPAVSTDAG